MIILGGLLCVVAIVLLVLAHRASQRGQAMVLIPTRKVAEATELLRSVAEELGGEATGYGEVAEFKGTVACEEPLQGELSGQSAAMVRTRIEREIETREHYRDSKGNSRTRWQQSTETVHSTDLESAFALDDGTGQVRVLPTGARMDLVIAVDRFEQGDHDREQSAGEFKLEFAGLSFAVSGHGRDDRRTLGYRYREEVLPVGHALYVLGEVADTEDGVLVRKPSGDNKGTPFIVSTRSETELAEAAAGEAWKQRLAAGATGALGLGLILYDVLGPSQAG